MSRSRGHIMRVGARVFSSKAELEAAVKAELALAPIDVEFQSQLFTDIINTFHRCARAEGQRALNSFRYLSANAQDQLGLRTLEQLRGGKLMMAFFVPVAGWFDVSVYCWRQSSPDALIKAALRQLANAYIPLPEAGDRCATCGVAYDLEYHHIAPSFKEIAATAFGFVSEKEKATLFGYRKFASATSSIADYIPHQHAAALAIRDAHVDNDWAWLCRDCHRNVRR